jgi:hypothetical protein
MKVCFNRLEEFHSRTHTKPELIGQPGRCERKEFLIGGPALVNFVPAPVKEFKLAPWDVIVRTFQDIAISVKHVVTCDHHNTLQGNSTEAFEELTRQVKACGSRPVGEPIDPEWFKTGMELPKGIV